MIMGSLLHDFNSSIIPRIYTLTIIFIFLIKAQSFPPPHVNETSTAPPSIYQLLSTQALPMGLFPEGIGEFYLDNVSGRFELHLSHSCATKFETSAWWYDVTVSGTLSYGRISDLSGVAAQELFLWLPVKSIRVDIPSSGLIYFDVGVVNKQFSLSFFETPRVCTFLENDAAPASGSSLLPGDLVSIDDLGRIIETKSGKVLKQSYQEDSGRAVS